MRRINFDEHIRENKAKFRRYHLSRRKERLSQPLREHVHEPEERASLIQVNLRRLRKWFADGILEEIGHRKYRLKL